MGTYPQTDEQELILTADDHEMVKQNSPGL